MRSLLEHNPQLLYVLHGAVIAAECDDAGLIALGPDGGYGELLMLHPAQQWQAAFLHGPVISVISHRNKEEIKGTDIPVLTPYSNRPVQLAHAVVLPINSRIIMWADRRDEHFQADALDLLDASAWLCKDHLDKGGELDRARIRVQAASSTVESLVRFHIADSLDDMAQEMVKLAARMVPLRQAYFVVAREFEATIMAATGRGSEKFQGKAFDLRESLAGLAINSRSELPNDGVYQKGMTRLFGRGLSNPVSYGEGLFMVPVVVEDVFKGVLVVVGNGISDSYMRFYLRHAVQAAAYRTVTLQDLDQAVQKSMFDPLTNLYTRTAAQVRLTEVLAAARRFSRPLSVMMLDLDHFKHVNDTFGHQVGDRVLKYATHQIVKGLRESDMAARYGGEEFLVLLPETKKSEAEVIAERIRTAVSSAPVPIGAQSLYITISIGLTCCKDGECTAEEMVRNADRNLYRAKKSGRNKVVS